MQTFKGSIAVLGSITETLIRSFTIFKAVHNPVQKHIKFDLDMLDSSQVEF